MKRIYNDIPLQSVLFGLGGNQRVIIRDWDNGQALLWKECDWAKDQHKVAFDGNAGDLCGYQFFKINHAKYHGMEVTEDGTLVFDICTAFEQY